MSDTRFPSQVPTPGDDGASGAGTGRSADGQGRRPTPWPTPEHARPSTPPQGPPPEHAWPSQGPTEPAPEPTGQEPATGWGTRAGGWDNGNGWNGGNAGDPVPGGGKGKDSDEEAGEITAWGYPAYRDPEPAQKPGRPYPDARAPHPAPWNQDPGLPYPDARAPQPDPWSQESGAARAQAWASGAPPEAPRPQEIPATTERPFSYWENSNREHWDTSGQDRDTVTASPADHGPPSAPASPWHREQQSAPLRLDDYTRPQGHPDGHARGPGLPGLHRFQEPEQEPRAQEEAAAPPARKKREPYLDNVKFVLIALVVTGHSLVPTLAAHSAKSAYLFIYTFHMPAFVLISGYLGRNFWNSNAKINKLVDTMLVPYAFVEIGYALLRYALGQKWTLTIIDPAWLNWYLVALVLWRISTPIWTRMRQPLLVAVTVYMAAGFSEISGDFSLDRFFGLLPFYVCGLLLKPEHLDLLKPLWVRITAGVVVVAAIAVAVYIAPRIGLDPVYYRYSFKYMHISWWMGMIVRAGMLVAGLVLSVALLALVPRRETWFSDLGTRTLYAYLLHGVIVLIAKDQGWLSLPWLYGPLGVLAIASSALVLAIILCLPQTRTLFKWLLEPRLVWLYRRPSDRESSAAVPR
ncbi:acyltransferase family protein [Streptosporangium sp. NPDC051023]|uniref:acyltransferase family protein n=1 Tax=Streptosporangium sp. NPDC051023 TaxID=3155410 RepID=UPI003450A7E1